MFKIKVRFLIEEDPERNDTVDSFNTKKLRQLLGRSRKDISNKELYKTTKLKPISLMVSERRMKWAGHVRRMNDNRVPKMILFGEVVGNGLKQGRPPTSWTQCLEEDCRRRNIGNGGKNWIKESADRLRWRKFVSSPAFY